MPRYSYLCETCEQVSEIFHLINDNPENKCPSCLQRGGLVKMVSRPVISVNRESSETTARERVEEHIESARQELVQQRSELTKEDIINDN